MSKGGKKKRSTAGLILDVILTFFMPTFSSFLRAKNTSTVMKREG